MLIALGIMTGILGFLPLFLSLRLSRRSTSTHALTIGLYGLAGVAISCHTLSQGLSPCAMLCTRRLVGFVVAEGIVFLAAPLRSSCTRTTCSPSASAFKLN